MLMFHLRGSGIQSYFSFAYIVFLILLLFLSHLHCSTIYGFHSFSLFPCLFLFYFPDLATNEVHFIDEHATIALECIHKA